jgi:MoaA/NifB/PqqE/SkfB family radical SAM enzyme
MKPILLHYYITNRCNARCTFCSIWSEKPKYDVRIDDVFKNLKTAKRLGCRFVDFTGGEPLLHSDLPIFLTEAKKLGFITSVTTNCILFPSRVKELTGKIDLLHFSIDADNAPLHNRIRGSSSFNAVLESIPLALQNDLIPDLLFTYTDENIDTFDGVYNLAKKNRLIAILDPIFSIDGADTVQKETHQKALLYAKKRGVYLNKAHLTLRSKGGNNLQKPICRAVTSTIVITPENNRAYPCFHHSTKFIPLGSGLKFERKNLEIHQHLEKIQGRYSFCEGCHINCYFDPSYNYRVNRLFFQSLAAKFSYISMKYFIYWRIRAFLRLY